MRYRKIIPQIIRIVILLLSGTNLYSQQNNFYNLNLQLKIPEKFYEVYFVDSLTGWIGGGHGLLLKTTDGGIEWKQEDLGLTSDIKRIQFTSRNTGWMYTRDTCLKTTDGGNSWFRLSQAFDGPMHFYKDDYGWAASSGRAFYKSTDGGKSWKYVMMFQDIIEDIHFFDSNNGYVLGHVIGQSSNGGNSWSYIYPESIKSAYYFSRDEVLAVSSNGYITKISSINNYQTIYQGPRHTLNDIHCFNHSYGYAVGDRGTILKTRDSIDHWDTIPRLTYNNLYSVFLTDSNSVWIGGEEVIFTNHTGVFSCTDIKDTTVKSGNQLAVHFGAKGIPAPVYHLVEFPKGMTIDTISGKINWQTNSAGSYKIIVEAINKFGVKRDSFNITVEPLSGVNAEFTKVPDNFDLTNYPNPFNPMTTISFSLPKGEFVSLKIYDSNGKEIAEPVKDYKTPGIYSIKFDASYLSSGIYLCKITAGKYSKTKKLLLLK